MGFLVSPNKMYSKDSAFSYKLGHLTPTYGLSSKSFLANINGYMNVAMTLNRHDDTDR